MGGGNSSFTTEQTREITQLMKLEYEICQKKGLSLKEEQEQLLLKYQTILQQLNNNNSNNNNSNNNNLNTLVSTAQPKVVVANSRRLSRGYSKDEHGIQPKSSRTRRRSFDNKPTPSTPKKGKDMQSSSSTPSLEAKVLEEPPAQVDTWDSVNGQPSCLICSMVFATPQKLETHTKYSSLHASNLKKLQQASLDSLNEETEPAKPAEPSSAEPSSRCRVMYTGTKFFWKTQDNIDIHIYYHIDTKCIEVIAYEGKANTELPRIYLNESALIQFIGEDSIMERVREIQKDASNKRFKEALPPIQILFEEEKRISISSHILSHLQMMTSATTSAQYLTKKYLKYVLHGDSGLSESSESKAVSTDDIEYKTKPENVIPVYIARRRHTSEEEIKETLTDINTMQMDIRSMTQKAEKMANLVTKASQSLSSGLKKRKWQKENLSKMRLKWLWAIDFIIRKNRVAITREVLSKYNGKY